MAGRVVMAGLAMLWHVYILGHSQRQKMNDGDGPAEVFCSCGKWWAS